MDPVLPIAGDDRDIGLRFVTGDGPTVLEFAGHRVEIVIGAAEHRIQTDHVAEGISQVHVELESAQGKDVAQGTDVGGIHAAGIDQVLLQEILVPLLEVNIGYCRFTRLVDEGRETLGVQAGIVVREEAPDGIAFESEAGTGDQVERTDVALQLGDLVPRVRIDEVGRPGEALRLDVLRREGDLVTVRLHGSHVAEARSVHGRDGTDQVVVVTLVPVEGKVDPVVEETGLETEVQLMLLLVGQGLVGHVVDVEGRLLVVRERTPGVGRADDDLRVGHARAVAGQGVRTLKAEVGHRRVERLHPVFLVDVPRGRDVPGGQPARGTRLAETVGTFVTVRAVERVLSFIGIGTVGEERNAAAAGVGHREVLGVLFRTLLEHAPVVVGDLAEIVLHTPTAEPDAVTVDVVDLGTAEEIHDVVLEEGVIVGRRGTDVPAVHAVVGTLIDTADGQDRDRQRIRVLGIRVQEGVGIPDGSRGHLAVCERLVGAVPDVVLLRRGGCLIGRQGAQIQVVDRFVLQLALHAKIMDIEVDVVVLQLMQNVEFRIVAGIELIGVQRTGRIQRIGVRVDVEVTLDFAGHDVHLAVDGTRRTLLTVGSVADQVGRQALRELVRNVEVAGVAGHRALLGPTRIGESGQGGVVGTLPGTAGHADGVVAYLNGSKDSLGRNLLYRGVYPDE